jgi:hypothetical protein
MPPDNSLIYSFDIFGLEGRPSDDESIQDDTNRPSINLEAVPIDSIEQHFRCNIVRSTTNGLLPLARALNERSESKVTDFDIHIYIEEQVPQFEITMDDLVRVHVVARPNELYHKVSCFWLGEAPPATEHVHERATWAKFECHVDVLVIFKTILETHDVGMFECAMNLNLGVQLVDYNFFKYVSTDMFELALPLSLPSLS